VYVNVLSVLFVRAYCVSSYSMSATALDCRLPVTASASLHYRRYWVSRRLTLVVMHWVMTSKLLSCSNVFW